ncbi:MAG: TMEM165/GDT1 family protein [Phenylobacterium sp.]|nr:MAG: TMEM165/GDT1 family protein [Phenylobacterium sp.]
MNLEPFFTSTAVVAIGEIGDKTQLLAIVLAAKFRKPWPIIAGVLGATILNHTLAATVGYLVSDWLSGRWFRVAVGAAFIAMAAWALIPDKEDESAADRTHGGVFLTTLVSFFFVEIGDKTQIATSLLAARYHQIAMVAAGTTIGMLIADVPAIFLGEAVTRIVPLNVVRMVAAAIFGLIGVWVLLAAFGVV